VKSEVYELALRWPTKMRIPSALLPESLRVSISPFRSVTENSLPSAIRRSAASAPLARAFFSRSAARSW
jgi:hypothetical protein